MVMLLITSFTPWTFLAIFVALLFCFSCSTLPVSVTTPLSTETPSAPPFTSTSVASLIRTWSLIASSDIGLSAASATPRPSNSASRGAQTLFFIFSGHCTPVERIEEGGLLAPSGLHAHVQIEVHVHAEDPLHLLA